MRRLSLTLTLVVAVAVFAATHLAEGDFQQALHELSAALALAARRLHEEANRLAALNWHRAPAVSMGMLTLLAVPALALSALAVRLLVGTAKQLAVVSGARAKIASPDLIQSPMARAWIEVDGQRGTSVELAHEIVRIGRDLDNELALPDHDLEGIHAVIRRTPDAEFVVVDVTGAEGGGVAVNGRALSNVTLMHGDQISLGSSCITFHRALSLPVAALSAASSLTH